MIPGRRGAKEVCLTIILAYYREKLSGHAQKAEPSRDQSLHGGLGARSSGSSEQLKTTRPRIGENSVPQGEFQRSADKAFN